MAYLHTQATARAVASILARPWRSALALPTDGDIAAAAETLTRRI
jgi:hypothetical protein